MKRVKKSDPKSYFYAESSLVCFEDDGIKGMLQITEAIDIKGAVEKELDWFASTYSRPFSVISHPATYSIKKFQNLLYGEKFDKQIAGLQMPPMKLRISVEISGYHLIMYIGCLTIQIFHRKKLSVFTSITCWM